MSTTRTPQPPPVTMRSDASTVYAAKHITLNTKPTPPTKVTIVDVQIPFGSLVMIVGKVSVIAMPILISSLFMLSVVLRILLDVGWRVIFRS